MESLAQSIDVGLRKIALSIEHLGSDARRAKNVLQIYLSQTVGIHQMAHNVDRRCRRKSIMLILEIFYE
jgi:hypothetical protein